VILGIGNRKQKLSVLGGYLCCKAYSKQFSEEYCGPQPTSMARVK
jgi:hypothetical protein